MFCRVGLFLLKSKTSSIEILVINRNYSISLLVVFGTKQSCNARFRICITICECFIFTSYLITIIWF